jgi:hypothetical protein
LVPEKRIGEVNDGMGGNNESEERIADSIVELICAFNFEPARFPINANPT